MVLECCLKVRTLVCRPSGRGAFSASEIEVSRTVMGDYGIRRLDDGDKIPIMGIVIDVRTVFIADPKPI